MKKQKGIILSAIFILIIITGILIWNNQNSEPNIGINLNQNCTIQGDYCVYDNIPTYLEYTKGEEIPPNLEANRQEVLTQYLKRTSSEGKTLNEGFGLDPEKYVCSNGEEILVVKYFYATCEGMEGLAGCGHDRTAYVCGDFYFIEEYQDWSGPLMYGPFYIEE